MLLLDRRASVTCAALRTLVHTASFVHMLHATAAVGRSCLSRRAARASRSRTRHSPSVLASFLCLVRFPFPFVQRERQTSSCASPLLGWKNAATSPGRQPPSAPPAPAATRASSVRIFARDFGDRSAVRRPHGHAGRARRTIRSRSIAVPLLDLVFLEYVTR